MQKPGQCTDHGVSRVLGAIHDAAGELANIAEPQGRRRLEFGGGFAAFCPGIEERVESRKERIKQREQEKLEQFDQQQEDDFDAP